MHYRQIWINENGPIPVDKNGRSYEIHHIDGNRNNNSIENLMCLSIEEHFKIHYEQGDYHAAYLIACRAEGIDPKEIAALVLKEKKHSWQKENRKGRLGNEFTPESASKLAKERASKGQLPAQISARNGTHHWQTKENSKRVSELNKKLKSNTVTVTDVNGNNKQITKEMFEQQKVGPRTEWTYVGVASREAKIRRGEI